MHQLHAMRARVRGISIVQLLGTVFPREPLPRLASPGLSGSTPWCDTARRLTAVRSLTLSLGDAVRERRKWSCQFLHGAHHHCSAACTRASTPDAWQRRPLVDSPAGSRDHLSTPADTRGSVIPSTLTSGTAPQTTTIIGANTPITRRDRTHPQSGPTPATRNNFVGWSYHASRSEKTLRRAASRECGPSPSVTGPVCRLRTGVWVTAL